MDDLLVLLFLSFLFLESGFFFSAMTLLMFPADVIKHTHTLSRPPHRPFPSQHALQSEAPSEEAEHLRQTVESNQEAVSNQDKIQQGV